MPTPPSKQLEELRLIGLRIRAVRKDRGWSQEGFAHQVGMARSYYSGVERGRRNISAVNLVRIALSLEVEVGELFPPVEQLNGMKAGNVAQVEP